MQRESHSETVDDSHLTVVEISDIHSKKLILNRVLHLLNLDCNLLSVRKLIQDYNCIAKFY